MPAFTGTGNIRQNRQNSNLNTYGLNVFQILQNKNLNTQYFYFLLGSGPQTNRIYYYNRRRGIPSTF
jgi:hypothetical protein